MQTRVRNMLCSRCIALLIYTITHHTKDRYIH